jgi:glycine/D-amino acid oxidase-like deaminating enzyme
MTAARVEVESPAEYDLVVIGSGPAGQKAAIAAAKLGKRVAVIDRPAMIGGISLHSGTIPSKTAREAALYLTGFRQRSFYGESYTLKEQVTVSDLRFRVEQVVAREREVVEAQLQRNGIEIIPGLARFLDPHTVEIIDDGQRVGDMSRKREPSRAQGGARGGAVEGAGLGGRSCVPSGGARAGTRAHGSVSGVEPGAGRPARHRQIAQRARWRGESSG